MTRRRRTVGEIYAGSYVLDDGVLHRLAHVLPVPKAVPGLPSTDVVWLFASGLSVTHELALVVELPTSGEIAEARHRAETDGYRWFNFPPLGETVREVFGDMYADGPRAGDGYAPTSGHAVPLPADAVRYDRFDGAA